MFFCLLLFRLTAFWNLTVAVVSAHESQSQRCRTTEDLGRIPWFLPNSTFHNLGFPLVRTLCDDNIGVFKALGCANVEHIEFLYESVKELRSGNRSSTIIVDPHLMQSPKVPSSGAYVILAMFEILYGLEYLPAVRHWSEGLSEMFPASVAAAASKVSRRYEAYENGKGENPFANVPNHILMQIEVPYSLKASVPVNPSPYARTFRWIVGFHKSHGDVLYQHSDPTSHCTAANFHQVRGRMCTTSGVIPCPQYDFHRTRSLEVTPETRKSNKKNIILFDDDQTEIDMYSLKEQVMKLGGLDDLQVLHNIGRKKTDMPDLYKQVKMTIDCRNLGVEFINYEASLYDVMTLSCDMRATRNVFDFPVPSKYHINPSNWTQLVHLVHDSMVNYEERVEDFKHFKRLSRTSTQMAKTQVDMHYFSRDVMFRTHCASYAECRRVYPWAVAVWTLYPLAMIEVVTELDISELALDSDLVRMTLSELFTSMFFRVINGVPGVAPVDLFPRAPCAYMVYMDASFIPFGRDFLNTHVAALVKDPRPILYWQGDKKLAIAVMHARPYMKLFKDAAGGRTIYVEMKYSSRAIGNYDTYLDLLKVCSGPESVPSSYRSQLTTGDSFYQHHLTKMLSMYPALPRGPCDDSNSNVTMPGRPRHYNVSPSEENRPHHPRHPHYRDSHQTCAPPDNLIIDAVYVPMPLGGDRTSTQGPSIWLTSSLVPISFKTVFASFSKKQIKTIVQHLDPILQNPNMLKILMFIPSDIAEALQQFDAANYPDVISLRDMEYPYWGEKCA